MPGRLVLGGGLDGGLGEGHPQVVVLTQVVVVQVDERLDGLLHGAHLDQRHFAVLPAGKTRGTQGGVKGRVGQGRPRGSGARGWGWAHWKNLNPFTIPPLLEKRILRSSSEMEGLQGERGA